MDHRDRGVTEEITISRPAPATYARTPPPLIAISGAMTTVLIVASITTAAGVIVTITHAAAGIGLPDPVSGLVYALMGVSWTAVVQIAVRDRQDRRADAARADLERMQARLVELYRRQDHSTLALAALHAGQREQAVQLARIAAALDTIRDGISDALEIADADAELTVRQQQAAPPVPAIPRPRLVTTTNRRPS